MANIRNVWLAAEIQRRNLTVLNSDEVTKSLMGGNSVYSFLAQHNPSINQARIVQGEGAMNERQLNEEDPLCGALLFNEKDE